VYAAVEAIQAHAEKTVKFPITLIDELKQSLPETDASVDSRERMAAVIDGLEASVSGDKAAQHGSNRFRDLHARAAQAFARDSVRLDLGDQRWTDATERGRHSGDDPTRRRR